MRGDLELVRRDRSSGEVVFAHVAGTILAALRYELSAQNGAVDDGWNLYRRPGGERRTLGFVDEEEALVELVLLACDVEARDEVEVYR